MYIYIIYIIYVYVHLCIFQPTMGVGKNIYMILYVNNVNIHCLRFSIWCTSNPRRQLGMCCTAECSADVQHMLYITFGKT